MNGSVLAALGIYTRNMDIHILARFRNIRKHTFAVNDNYAYVRIIRFTRFQVFPLNIYKSCPFGFRQCRYIRTVAAMYRNTSSLCYEADYIVARHRVAAAGYPYHKIVGSLYYYTRIIPYQAVRLFALCIVRFRRLCPLIVFYVIELLLLVIIPEQDSGVSREQRTAFAYLYIQVVEAFSYSHFPDGSRHLLYFCRMLGIITFFSYIFVQKLSASGNIIRFVRFSEKLPYLRSCRG